MFKTSALRTADADTENSFSSIQLSTRWSSSPLWYCCYSADAGHPPLRAHEPSPARQFLHQSLAVLSPGSLLSRQGADSTSPAHRCNKCTRGSS